MRNKSNIYIGVMTGTSMDGIDIAVAQFGQNSIDIIANNEYSFTVEIQEYLHSLRNEITLYELSQLNVRFANEIANKVNLFLEENNIHRSDVNSIGFHGQTLWHQPSAQSFCNQQTSSTLQIGSPSELAIKTGIDVVSDFRQADIALGGQGAPLVPIFDYTFLRSDFEDTIVLNIGGIANITYLAKGCDKAGVIAFDTGPGNSLIDAVTNDKFNMDYDKDGQIARKGKPDFNLLNELMKVEYINSRYPKSTGKELFNYDIVNEYSSYNLNDKDLLCTMTHYTAKSIAVNIDMIVKSKYKLLVAGGGANNTFLLELLEKYTETKPQKIQLDEKDITNSRESLLMAYLAYSRINNLPANIPNVTGASTEVVLGAVTFHQ